MTQRIQPPYRAEHVGSLIRPGHLRAARAQWTAGKLSKEALRAIEDQHIREAVAMQERVGMPSISDGEFRRQHWNEAFRRAVDGYGKGTMGGSFSFTMDDGSRRENTPIPLIEKRFMRREKLVCDEFAFLKSLTQRTAKATLPSPSMQHHQAGDAQINKAIYPDRHAFMADVIRIYREEIADLGKLGCTFLQIDECALPVLCDPRNRERVVARGESPEANRDFYVDALNEMVRDKPPGMTICLHMCRGNAGQGMAAGGYDFIAESVFGKLNVDGYLLEYESPRAGDFSPLKHIPKGKIAILGVMSTKLRELETIDAIRQRIDEAAKFIDMDQLGICPQCGFASSYQTDRFTTDDVERKLVRLLEASNAIWGGK
ncbi:MAG: cobalamin-independent methionine synthase II family protein [Burkholderiales bacterium]